MRGLFAVLVVLFTVVVGRLGFVQVVGAGRYVDYGEDQRVRGIALAAGRGAILDRNDYDLAISMPLKTVVADPRLVDNPRGTARRLAPILQVDEAELAAKLTSDKKFVYLARRVDDEVAAAVRRLDIEGLFFPEEPERFNPAGELGRSVLGRVVDSSGVSGLELRFNDDLTGSAGELVLEHDQHGRTIPAGRRKYDPPTPGDDLVLTIDRALQYETERILTQQVQATGARGGTAIVSQPETGEILTLANVELDSKTGRVGDSGNNLAVTQVYEPGSVNKVITLSAALQEGLVTPETVRIVPDTLRVADHTYSDSHSHPPEPYTVTRILADSSNIGTIQIAQQLGKDRLDEYFHRFGFGEKTALDLPSEQAGALLDPDDWSGTSIGSIPIGHGISVTAMQMLYAYNTIANDGVYLPPRLVAASVDENGERHHSSPGDGRRVVSPTTARQMRDMLAEVVRTGTGKTAAIEAYEVAGKTGTARKPQPGGGYTDAQGRYHHVATFAGFVPAQDPKVSVIIVIDEPSLSPYASTVAAPAFAEVARHALRLLRIPPASGGQALKVFEEATVRADAAAPPTTVPPTTTTPRPTSTTQPPGATSTTVVGGRAR